MRASRAGKRGDAWRIAVAVRWCARHRASFGAIGATLGRRVDGHGRQGWGASGLHSERRARQAIAQSPCVASRMGHWQHSVRATWRPRRRLGDAGQTRMMVLPLAQVSGRNSGVRCASNAPCSAPVQRYACHGNSDRGRQAYEEKGILKIDEFLPMKITARSVEDSNFQMPRCFLKTRHCLILAAFWKYPIFRMMCSRHYVSA